VIIYTSAIHHPWQSMRRARTKLATAQWRVLACESVLRTITSHSARTAFSDAAQAMCPARPRHSRTRVASYSDGRALAAVRHANQHGCHVQSSTLPVHNSAADPTRSASSRPCRIPSTGRRDYGRRRV